MYVSTYIHSASRGGVGGRWGPKVERGAILLAVATVATAAPPLFLSLPPASNGEVSGLLFPLVSCWFPVGVHM